MKWYYWVLIAVVVIGLGYILIKNTSSQAAIVAQSPLAQGFDPYQLVKIT